MILHPQASLSTPPGLDHLSQNTQGLFPELIVCLQTTGLYDHTVMLCGALCLARELHSDLPHQAMSAQLRLCIVSA